VARLSCGVNPLFFAFSPKNCSFFARSAPSVPSFFAQSALSVPRTPELQLCVNVRPTDDAKPRLDGLDVNEAFTESKAYGILADGITEVRPQMVLDHKRLRFFCIPVAA
jgi:hypothetical protein